MTQQQVTSARGLLFALTFRIGRKLILFSIATIVSMCGLVERSEGQEFAEPIPTLRSLDSYFPMVVPETRGEWETRRQQLREHLLVALGLWPLPPKPPIQATIHGRRDQGDYTIEKVFFESMPGFWVTGNLYRPRNHSGLVPGVLCPHGHHRDGRFRHASEAEIAAEMASGAESFESNARSILQARCANLARMGCVVFHYDMVGYADSQQISYALGHGFSKQRPEMNHPERWGLFSPQAEANLQTVMALQTWNSVRALDFLESLPDVDPQRLGVTGASGGGTQTFILAAIDDRPAVAFPAVMVSTAMQGGCPCENCSYLRVGTGNVEIAALFAPKPLGLTAADDWTREMVTKGFPELKALYRLLGAENHVELTSRLEFGHNYNQVGREAMYRWFQKHLQLEGEPIEKPIPFVDPQELSVFDETYPPPPSGEDWEAQWLHHWRERDQQRITEFLKSEAATGDDFESLVGTFVQVVSQAAEAAEGTYRLANGESAGAGVSSRGDPESGAAGEASKEWRIENRLGMVTRSRPKGTLATPDVLLLEWNATAGERADGDDADGESRWLADRLNEEGWGVYDVVREWWQPAERSQIRMVDSGREVLAYTTGYNPPQLVSRARSWTALPGMWSERPIVIALGETAPEVAFNARALRTADSVAGLVVDTRHFRFHDLQSIRDPNLLPGGAKYGDLPGLLSLAAPLPMLLFGEDDASAAIIRRAYELAGHPERLTIATELRDEEAKREQIVQWIRSIRK